MNFVGHLRKVSFGALFYFKNNMLHVGFQERNPTHSAGPAAEVTCRLLLFI